MFARFTFVIETNIENRKKIDIELLFNDPSEVEPILQKAVATVFKYLKEAQQEVKKNEGEKNDKKNNDKNDDEFESCMQCLEKCQKKMDKIGPTIIPC